MILPKKMNAVGIVVRDLERSLRWYKEKFGFKKLYDVSNGLIIGSNGVELWIAQVNEPENAIIPDCAKDICIRLIGFEVSEEDLAKVKGEFPEDGDIVEIDHPKYKSYIIEDPDGHAIELFVDK
jgi:catechol 2,3-dioxygenase-like lactoylglutathione lyase family enzyme